MSFGSGENRVYAVAGWDDGYARITATAEYAEADRYSHALRIESAEGSAFLSVRPGKMNLKHARALIEFLLFEISADDETRIDAYAQRLLRWAKAGCEEELDIFQE